MADFHHPHGIIVQMLRQYCLECNISTKKSKGRIVSSMPGSLFCEACQPKLLQPRQLYPMIHGYFYPFTNTMHGDAGCAYEAKEIYKSFGFPFNEDTNNYIYAGKYDGVSCYFLHNNTLVKRVCLTDFFSIEPKVVIRDYPF